MQMMLLFVCGYDTEGTHKHFPAAVGCAVLAVAYHSLSYTECTFFSSSMLTGGKQLNR